MAMFPTATSSQLASCCYFSSPLLPSRFCTQRGLAAPSSFVRASALATPTSVLSGGAGRAPPQAVNVERDLHMATGDGENSYAVNSSFQKKTLMETWPVLRKAVKEVLKSVSPGSTMVAADIGCSSGPNTLLLVSEVMNTVNAHVRETAADDNSRAKDDIEVQFFLNDLPGNDFNLVFRSLEQLHSLAAVEDKAPPASPCYIAGLPGSMYTRIFPYQSVHLFHSSHCLIWRSKVPEDLSNGTHVNDDNIYIGKTTPQAVVQLFREQFEKDFQMFLTLRHKELVSDGQMVLTFVGRNKEEMPMHGGVALVWEALSQALRYLVQKGRVEKKKLSSFNMPYYAPSLDEVTQVIKKTNLFDIEELTFFESNWDAHDDSDGDVVLDCSSSAANIAKIVRAGIEPLVADQFGEEILDELFMAYTSILAKNLDRGKAMCPVIVVNLKKSATARVDTPTLPASELEVAK
ncbi:hypothetical protein GUJ93_ZPchr0011g28874 [Zizania palustris]|uniref:Uncharacterized protein n=1 Tax=Zizania palustris TaxID=103762 RepID=A0A8J5WJV5_ZIZPA|nr:hypothetical protein GUJ93_ZPchr0011g28874 [Zizania palustris]